MRSLTYQIRMFVDYYLNDPAHSAVDAARRAGYQAPDRQGPRLLNKRAVQAAIEAEPESPALPAKEVLARTADIASADLMDFMAVDKNGGFKVDLRIVKHRGLGHLIKRVRINKDGSQHIELEPRMPALAKIGDYHKLWKGEGQPQLTLCDLAKNMRAEYERIEREEREGRAGDGATADVVSRWPGAVQ